MLYRGAASHCPSVGAAAIVAKASLLICFEGGDGTACFSAMLTSLRLTPFRRRLGLAFMGDALKWLVVHRLAVCALGASVRLVYACP